MTKLSPRMIETLKALENGERGSYPGLSLGTLNALSLRQLVAARYEQGSMAFPHTSIKWRLTSEGRSALQAAEGA